MHSQAAPTDYAILAAVRQHALETAHAANIARAKRIPVREVGEMPLRAAQEFADSIEEQAHALRDTQPVPEPHPTEPPPPCPPTEPVLPGDPLPDEDEAPQVCTACQGEGVVGTGGHTGDGEPMFIETCLECQGKGVRG